MKINKKILTISLITIFLITGIILLFINIGNKSNIDIDTNNENNTGNEYEQNNTNTENNIDNTTTDSNNTTDNNKNKLEETVDKPSIDTEEKDTSDNKIDDIITNKKNIIITDESKSTDCAQAIEYYYEDNYYKYYFTCIKSHNIYVTVNGNKYTIKEALNNNIVTISELEEVGFKPLKQSKNTSTY